MNGPAMLVNAISTLPEGVTLIGICGVQQSPPQDLAEAEDMLQHVTPELERRATGHRATCGDLQMLGNAHAELNSAQAKVEAELQPLRMSSWVEAVRNFGACDMLALSEQLRPLEYQLKFISDAKDLLVFKMVPAARLRMLESALNLRKIEALEANLLAAISHERTMQRAAGVFEEEGHVAIVGERTQALRKHAVEAERRVGLAEEELREERKRQLTEEQQRFACHQVTRAEVVASIPACAALLT